jgi:hypothetical protein
MADSATGETMIDFPARVAPQEGNILLPLDVLVVGTHHHGPGYDTVALMRMLGRHPAVKRFGCVHSLYKATRVVLEEHVDVLFLDPFVERGHVSEVSEFIAFVRQRCPQIVFVLYADEPDRPYNRLRELIEHAPHLEHYFRLHALFPAGRIEPEGEIGPDAAAKKVWKEFENIMVRCDEWHRSIFDYDVAISFAGSDRPVAQELAKLLTAGSARVFFDEYEKDTLLGKDLFTHLHHVYSKRARFCATLVSTDYSERVWTSHERIAIQERALKEKHHEYILPIRIDDTVLPGLPETIGYMSIDEGLESIAQTILNKAFIPEDGLVKRKLANWLFDYS